MSNQSSSQPPEENKAEEDALNEFLAGFGLPAKDMSPSVGLLPHSHLNETVLREFFEIRPTCKSVHEAVNEISKKTGISYTKIMGVVGKASAQAEAKRQREDYADQIYSQKLPIAKSIVGKTLTQVDNFLTTFKPTTSQEAKDLVKMATDMTTLLRLELGESTSRVEIITKTHKDVTVILDELKANDPFMDYSVTDDE